MNNKRDRLIIQLNKLNKRKTDVNTRINNDILDIKKYIIEQNLEKETPKIPNITYNRHKNIKLKTQPEKVPETVQDIIKSLDIINKLDYFNQNITNVDIGNIINDIKKLINYVEHEKIINAKKHQIDVYNKDIRVGFSRINEYKKKIFNNEEDILCQKNKEDHIKEREINRILCCIENMNNSLLNNLEEKILLKDIIKEKISECSKNISIYQKNISKLSLNNLNSRRDIIKKLKNKKIDKQKYNQEISNIQKQINENDKNINSFIFELKSLNNNVNVNDINQNQDFSYNNYELKHILRKKISKLENEKKYLLLKKEEIENKYNKDIDCGKVVKKHVLLELKKKLNENISDKNNLSNRLLNYNSNDIGGVFDKYYDGIEKLKDKYSRCLERKFIAYSRLDKKKDNNLEQYNETINEITSNINDYKTLIDVYNKEIEIEKQEFEKKSKIFLELCDKLMKLQEKSNQFKTLLANINSIELSLSK
jgi:hypothetical protein